MATRAIIVDESDVRVGTGTNPITVSIDGTNPPSTASISRVATSTVSAQLFAANANRKKFIISNESDARMYVKFGVTASTSSYTLTIEPRQNYESFLNDYDGRVDAIIESGTGNAQVTELTA